MPVVEKKANCPSDMKFVSGDWCPEVEEICLYDVDANGNKLPSPHDPNVGRCGAFKSPAKCLSKTRKHLSFCIDIWEWPNRVGERPQTWMSFDDAVEATKAVGKRVCRASEWELAAETAEGSDEIYPLPYGNGFSRDRDQKLCDFDNHYNGIDVFKATSPTAPASIALQEMLWPAGRDTCCNRRGVCNQAGGADEWVYNDTTSGYKTGLKGGHVFGVRCAARPMTVSHNGSGSSGFRWYETSTRGCKDPTQ
jgi:hypothetical protein